jgi:hypothetical protein
MDKRATLAEIEEIIRRYLQAHPQAEDTERGICEWWLRTARRTYPVADVGAAIHALVGAGELEQRELPDRQRLYASARTPRSRSPRNY